MTSGLVIENGILISAPLNEREVSIPAEVTRIGKGAFKDSQVENVTFEGSALKSIDEEAFFNCSCLKSIVVPDGVIQIADRAFAGCTGLKYISIPDSILLIGKGILDDCSSDLFIIGKEEKEAGRIANQYGLALRSDSQSAISAFEKAKDAKEALETKVFDVFGEEVSCPNTLIKYYNILAYYAERKDSLFNDCVSRIPTKLSGRFENVADPLTREWEKTIERLASQGVFIQKKNLSPYILEPIELFGEVVQLLSKAHTAVQKGITIDIDKNREALQREAESKVTGLSYVTISSSMLTLIGHELDDYNERKRQRREAYAEAEKKFAQVKENAKNEGEKKYAEFVSQTLLIMRQATDRLIEALCKAETDHLIKAGLIDESVETDFDPEKSAELMKSIANKTGDNSFTVALALKKYPGNMSALVYAKEHGYECQGLNDLVQFLNLERELETRLEENRNERYIKIYSSLLNVKNADSGIKLIKENEASIEKNKVEQLIKTLAGALSKNIVGILNSAVSSRDYDSVAKCQEYCTSQLNGIISSDAWSFFLEHDVSPIQSPKLKKTDDYYELRDWISEQLFINLQERERRRIAAEKEEEERQIKAKKAKKKRITILSIISALIVAGIVFAIVCVKVIIPTVKYNEAVQLINEGRYDDAILAFEALDGYKDSREKANDAKGEKNYNIGTELMNEGKYEEAIYAFREAHGYKDSSKQIALCTTARNVEKYDAAVALMNSGKYEEAIDAFKNLDGYMDSTEKIDLCKSALMDGEYDAAIALMNSGEYEKAIAAFETISHYKDSKSKIDACKTAIKDRDYDNAVNLMNEGEYKKAIYAFEAMNGYKDSLSKIMECQTLQFKSELSSIDSGSVIHFGQYEQDNNLSNGMEKIEWIVLFKDRDKALILSRYALDFEKYNLSKKGGATWEKCQLRTSLNEEFFNVAFRNEDQQYILNSRETNDKIFLLSESEVNKYLGSDSERKCRGTEFCLAQVNEYAQDNGFVSWWLRSPGGYTSTAAKVWYSGSIGHEYVNRVEAVRPAMWIKRGS